MSVPMESVPHRLAIARAGASARVHAARMRRSQTAELALPVLVDGTAGLFRAVTWSLVFVGNVVLAMLCVPSVWALPSAIVLTLGLWLIGNSLELARAWHLRSLWWRCLLAVRRCCTADNACQMVFLGGLALALWNLSGLYRA